MSLHPLKRSDQNKEWNLGRNRKKVLIQPKLSEWLASMGYGKYTKNRKDMYEILRPFMDTAIANAYRLEEINTGRTPSASKPGTRVHELIQHLKPYLD